MSDLGMKNELRVKIEEIIDARAQEFLNEIDQETDERVVGEVVDEILAAFSFAMAKVSIDKSERAIWEQVDSFEPQDNGHHYSIWTTGEMWGCMKENPCETLIIGFASKDDARAYAAEQEIDRLAGEADHLNDREREAQEAGDRR